MTNRRENTRVEFKATVDLDFSGRTFNDFETSDLSLYGVFVSGIQGVLVGAHCDLSLHLSAAASDTVLHMKGEVMRVEEGGIGLKFLEIDQESFYHLKNILYYNSGDPDVLQKEFRNQLVDKS